MNHQQLFVSLFSFVLQMFKKFHNNFMPGHKNENLFIFFDFVFCLQIMIEQLNTPAPEIVPLI